MSDLLKSELSCLYGCLIKEREEISEMYLWLPAHNQPTKPTSVERR